MIGTLITATKNAIEQQQAKPAFVLLINGTDKTEDMANRLMSLSLRDARGMEADTLTLTLDDHDGTLPLPPKGAVIELQLGYAGALVDKGRYTVDETNYDSPPDIVTVSARSATLGAALKEPHTKGWHFNTVGDIFTTIALRHGLEPVLDEAHAAIAIDHIDQTDESDVNFLTRLAQEHGAIAAIKSGKLLLVPEGEGTSASGKPLPTLALDRSQLSRISYQRADRDGNYTGVSARWQELATGTQHTITVGELGTLKQIKKLYRSDGEAWRAADAEFRRTQRGGENLNITLANGRAEIIPEQPVTISGLKAALNKPWRVAEITHTLGSDQGFISQITLEPGAVVLGERLPDPPEVVVPLPTPTIFSVLYHHETDIHVPYSDEILDTAPDIPLVSSSSFSPSTVQFSSDGSLMMIGSANEAHWAAYAYVYTVDPWQLKLKINSIPFTLANVQMSPDGRFIVGTGYGNMAVYVVATGQQIIPATPPPWTAFTVGFSPDGQYCYCSGDYFIYTYSLPTWAKVNALTPDSWAYTPSPLSDRRHLLSNDGTRLLGYGNKAPAIALYNTATWLEVINRPHTTGVRAAAFSADDQSIAYIVSPSDNAYDGYTVVINASVGTVEYQSAPAWNYNDKPLFSPNGAMLLVIRGHDPAIAYNTANYSQYSLPDTARFNWASFDSQSNYVAMGSTNEELTSASLSVFNAATMQPFPSKTLYTNPHPQTITKLGGGAFRPGTNDLFVEIFSLFNDV